MSYGHEIYFSKATFGTYVKILTVIFIFLVFLLIAVSIYFYIEGNLPLEALAFISALAIGIAIVPYMYAPKAYILTHKGLVIKRILDSIFIPYTEIAKVLLIDLKKLSSAVDIELWGSHGYCGVFGQFKMLKLGYVNLYVTKISKCILVEKNDGKKYVISPEKPEAFVRIMNGYVKLRSKNFHFKYRLF